MKQEIKMVKPDELIPYENNPRDNDNAVEAVANSIKEFGFKQPIVVDKNMVVIAGHTRLKASIELGLEEVPVLVADDLTAEQARAYRLVDNRTNEIANWNFDELFDELEQISLDLTVYNFPDVEKLERDLDELFYDSEDRNDHAEKEPKLCPHCGGEL